MIASGHRSAHARWKYVRLVSSLTSRARDSCSWVAKAKMAFSVLRRKRPVAEER
jgi:hypothetical protein